MAQGRSGRLGKGRDTKVIVVEMRDGFLGGAEVNGGDNKIGSDRRG